MMPEFIDPPPRTFICPKCRSRKFGSSYDRELSTTIYRCHSCYTDFDDSECFRETCPTCNGRGVLPIEIIPKHPKDQALADALTENVNHHLNDRLRNIANWLTGGPEGYAQEEGDK